MLTDPAYVLLQRWRRQICPCHTKREVKSLRRAAALGCLVQGNRSDQLVELDRLMLVVVYDEITDERIPAIRVSGYQAARIPHGVQWGGKTNSCIFKDLSLTPADGADGQRCDLRNTRLLRMALQLDSRIADAYRFLCLPRLRALRLPHLLAGFAPGRAADVAGQGPEFETLTRRFGMAPVHMLKIFERRHRGLVLYPLDWVSEELGAARCIFAELDSFPRRQVFRLRDPALDLVGYQGAMAFDFFHSRFRLKS